VRENAGKHARRASVSKNNSYKFVFTLYSGYFFARNLAVSATVVSSPLQMYLPGGNPSLFLLGDEQVSEAHVVDVHERD
jgi:hypothetical protein